MPVDRPLPYSFSYGFGRNEVRNYLGDFTETKNVSWSAENFFSPQFTRKLTFARNDAYSRLQAELSDKAGWAENVAQFGKTREGVVNRCVQLATAASAVKKARFREAARILRVPVPSGVSHRKAVSQNFLEFEYGWKPLISDIDASLEILTSDPGQRMIRSRSRDNLTYLTRTNTGNSLSGSTRTERANCAIDVRMGALVRVTNPNLFLANQLGIMDVSLPWKLLPFSFVVDWFVNVEQVLSSFTDWAGVSLQRQYTNTYSNGTHSVYSLSWFPVIGVPGGGWTESKTEDARVELERTTTITGPTLQVKPFKGFSLQRGAQAIALVLAVLGK